jgi:hypothetical protein
VFRPGILQSDSKRSFFFERDDVGVRVHSAVEFMDVMRDVYDFVARIKNVQCGNGHTDSSVMNGFLSISDLFGGRLGNLRARM